MMLQNADEFQISAQEDGEAVLAYMHATAVNQDGRSSSLTAPNGPSQQGVIRQALQASALEPEHMHALQLHGTGTITLFECMMMNRCHTMTMCLCTDAAVTMLWLCGGYCSWACVSASAAMQFKFHPCSFLRP